MQAAGLLWLAAAVYVILQVLGAELGFNLWAFLLWVAVVNLFLGLASFYSRRLGDQVMGTLCIIAAGLSFALTLYIGWEPERVLDRPDLLRWLLIALVTSTALAYCSWIVSDAQDVESGVVDLVTLTTVTAVIVLTLIADWLIYGVFEFVDALRELEDTPFGEVIPEEAVPESDRQTSDVDMEAVARFLALILTVAFFGAVLRLLALRAARSARSAKTPA